MTTVHISLGRDDGTDQTAAKGVVEWEPTTRREDGTMVILDRLSRRVATHHIGPGQSTPP